MKVDTTKLLLVALILIMGYQTFFKTEPEQEPQPVTITLPESFGTTGLQQLEPQVKVVPVYLPNTNGQAVNVDSEYKDLYEKTNDSLKRLNLYLDAIQVRKYSDTLVDNNEITIKGDATTRGSLLDFKVDYNIKEQEFEYTPEVITRHPKFSLGAGLEVGIPTIPTSNFLLKGNVIVTNKKGNQINLGYDTENRAWIGYTFNLFKTKK